MNTTRKQILLLQNALLKNFNAFNALSGNDALWIINHPKEAIALWVLAIRDRKRTRNIPLTRRQVLTPSVTIACGGVAKTKLICRVEDEKDLALSAKKMMHKSSFKITKTTGSHNLVFLHIADDLGFTDSPFYSEVMDAQFCATWSSQNLDRQVIELCQPEDAVHLILQEYKQPNNKVLYIAMDRIASSDGEPSIFSIECRRNSLDTLYRSLCSVQVSPLHSLNVGEYVVFRLRNIDK